MRRDFSFQDDYGNTIQAYTWMPEGEVKAIVQMVHGMAEYAERYERLALALNKVGYGVYINDTLGHGKSIKSENDLGHLPKGGFDMSVENIHKLHLIIQSEQMDKPIYILGHSMGSLMTQSYICKYGKEVNGCILVGTAGSQSLTGLAAFLSKISKSIHGERARSPFLDKLFFGNNNKGFQPKRTDFDWLSRDTEEVDKYIESPLCGFVCTTSFYYELSSSTNKLHNKDTVMNIPKDLPIYIVCGDSDPVGGKTKNVMNLLNMYKNLGIQDLEYVFYEGGRHEILNETNREEVIENIIKWLEKR